MLPFENLSGDPEQDYFADGLTEELITALSRFRELRVIARHSTLPRSSMNDPMVTYQAPQTKKRKNIITLRVTKSPSGDRFTLDMI